MATWYKLRVKDTKQETPLAKSIELEVPEEAGDAFDFEAGQFLNVRLEMDDAVEERSYSLSSPTLDEGLRITVKKIDGGKVSTEMVDTLEPGDEIECAPPEGRFTVKAKPDERRYHYFVAAGSGITPIFGLIKYLLEAEPKSQIHLLYGNRNEEDVIFKNELEALADKYKGQLYIKDVFSRVARPKWNIFKIDDSQPWHGRIDTKKVAKWMKRNDHRSFEAHYYVCGPGSMNQDVHDYWKQSGIPSKHIHVESFKTAEDRSEAAEEEGSWTLKAVLDGEEHTISVMGDKTILDALIDEGVDAPHSCTSGACATCMAKVLDGKVEMDVDFALADEEKEEGYVLTCQGRAKSPLVSVNYDL